MIMSAFCKKEMDEEKNYWIQQMNKIISEYDGKYAFYSTKEFSAYCYIGSKEIYVPQGYKRHPDSKSLFDIYHEIGHLETNTLDMESYQQEYLATVWAIHACNERNIYIPPRIITMYQRYIYEHRDKSPNRDKIDNKALKLPPLLCVDSNIKRPKQRREQMSYCMDLIDYLNSREVEFVDHRSKGGNLTIVGTEANISELIHTICSAYGIIGKYGTSLRAIQYRAGWWTKG